MSRKSQIIGSNMHTVKKPKHRTTAGIHAKDTKLMVRDAYAEWDRKPLERKVSK